MPNTEAGKRLFDYLCPEASLYAEGYFTEAIDAIEAEARDQLGTDAFPIAFPETAAAFKREAVAAEKERIAREVRAMPNLSPFPSDAPYVTRAAVLAIVNREDTDATD